MRKLPTHNWPKTTNEDWRLSGYLVSPSINTHQTSLHDVIAKVLYQGIIWEYFFNTES